MNIKQTKIWKFFSSLKLAVWLLAVIAVLSLIGTFIPQGQSPVDYIQRYGHSLYNFLNAAGFLNVYSTWWFILPLILLALNLTVCLINRFSLKPLLLGTMMSHFSVLVIFSGAIIGMFYGEKGYIQIKEGETINSFISKDKPVNLGFGLRLDDFIYEEHIDPKEKLLVYSKAGELLAELSPLVGEEKQFGDGFMVKVLRYMPDFSYEIATKQVISRTSEPRNPAIEIEFSAAGGSASGGKGPKTIWVFARYPDMHMVETDFKFVYQWAMRRPKDFISKVTVIKDAKEILHQDIKVNSPLRFQGYAFFQSSFDKENLSWSGLQVNKDPGVSVVYAGFILLVFGLSIIFYINPLVKRRG